MSLVRSLCLTSCVCTFIGLPLILSAYRSIYLPTKYNESFYVSKPEIIISESSILNKTYNKIIINNETTSTVLCSDIVDNYTSYNDGIYQCDNGYVCLQSHDVNCTTNYYVYGVDPTIYILLFSWINGMESCAEGNWQFKKDDIKYDIRYVNYNIRCTPIFKDGENNVYRRYYRYNQHNILGISGKPGVKVYIETYNSNCTTICDQPIYHQSATVTINDEYIITYVIGYDPQTSSNSSNSSITFVTNTQKFNCNISDHVCINNTRSRIKLSTVYFDSRNPSKFTYIPDLFDYHTREYDLCMGFGIFCVIAGVIFLIWPIFLFLRMVVIKRLIWYVKNNHNDVKCVICLGDLQLRFYNIMIVYEVTSCNHIYHRKCIKEWLKHDRSCPQCRNRI